MKIIESGMQYFKDLEKDILKEYDFIEEVEKETNINDIFIKSFEVEMEEREICETRNELVVTYTDIEIKNVSFLKITQKGFEDSKIELKDFKITKIKDSRPMKENDDKLIEQADTNV